MRKQLLGWVVLSTSLIATTGFPCSYDPFDLYITTASDIHGKGGELPLALSVAKDVSEVRSDRAFISRKTPKGELVWALNDGDNAIASQNALLELYGYFHDVANLEGLTPESFLSPTVRTIFQGISSTDLARYTNDGALVAHNNGKVREAVSKAFPGRDWDILNRMDRINKIHAHTKAPNFSRMSALASYNVVLKPTALVCMMLSYSRDIYTNHTLSLADQADQVYIANQAVRNLMLDWLATEATNAGLAGKDPEKTVHLRLNNKIQCSLKRLSVSLSPSTSVWRDAALSGPRVSDLACQDVRQNSAILREGKTPGELFIQVGSRLYTTECRIENNGDWIDFARWQSRDGSKSMAHLVSALASSPDLIHSKLGKILSDKKNQEKLIHPTQDKQGETFVTSALNECNATLKDQLNKMPVTKRQRISPSIASHGFDVSLDPSAAPLQRRVPRRSEATHDSTLSR